MRKGRDLKEWRMENNGEKSGPLTSLPVDRLTATDCNAAARANRIIKIITKPIIFDLGLVTIFIISGDEILSVNGMAVQGMSHSEAISIFKNIKIGIVTLHIARRDCSYKR